MSCVSVGDLLAAPDGVTHPAVRIAAEVTTFHKDLYVYVGVPAMGQGSGYDLV